MFILGFDSPIWFKSFNLPTQKGRTPWNSMIKCCSISG